MAREDSELEAALDADAQADAKAGAFALLDAVTRSGALPVARATLHVVLASTHGFDRTLLDTVVRGNKNPIEAVERSELIVATTVHDRCAAAIVSGAERARVATHAPMLVTVPSHANPPLAWESQQFGVVQTSVTPQVPLAVAPGT